MKSLKVILNEQLEDGIEYPLTFPKILSDLFNLRINTQLLHWNYKGNNFIEVHTYLDTVLEYLDEYIDLISEDIVQNNLFVHYPIVHDNSKVLTQKDFINSKTVLKTYTNIFTNFLSYIDEVLKDYPIELEFYNKANEDFIISLRKEINKTIWFITSTNK